MTQCWNCLTKVWNWNRLLFKDIFRDEIELFFEWKWMKKKFEKLWENLYIYSINPRVNYFPKLEDYISLENDKFEFLKFMLSLKTMINRTFFFWTPPPMKREVAFSVVVYDNYQYLHQAASRFMGECSQI